MIFRTALCDLIGIDYPIVQSGMGAIAGPELVAEVCRAGGLGILAGLNVPPDRLRVMIRRVRELTDRPFGVNLWLHRALRPPIDPDGIGDETLRGAQEMLNQFRQRLGVPATTARPARAPDVVNAAVEVVLDERPAVFSAALGWLEPALVESAAGAGSRCSRWSRTWRTHAPRPPTAPTSSWLRAAKPAATVRSTASPRLPNPRPSGRWRYCPRWSTP